MGVAACPGVLPVQLFLFLLLLSASLGLAFQPFRYFFVMLVRILQQWLLLRY